MMWSCVTERVSEEVPELYYVKVVCPKVALKEGKVGRYE